VFPTRLTGRTARSAVRQLAAQAGFAIEDFAISASIRTT
jgi:hypothetical protein